MSKGIIYQVDGSGSLTKMRPGKPASEDEIQRLIAQHPEMVTGIDEQMLLIRRELPIADRVDGSARWSLDHLFVTRDGKPVLVEVKQASNTQLRREVIGQLLEYAANAGHYWGRGKLAQCFFGRFEAEDDGAQALDSFLRGGGAGTDSIEVADPESFWDRVDSNLQAGVFKLVIVADEIPRELARIVEFLNEQMRVDVQAVELRWFNSDAGVTALVPRIIGTTERAAERKTDAAARPANDYWVQLKASYPDLVLGKPWKDDAQDFFILRPGDPKIVIGCRFIKGDLRLHAYFDFDRAKIAYRAVKNHAADVETRYGTSLEWDDMGNAKAARVFDLLSGVDRDDRSDWPRQHAWLATHGMRLGDAIRPLLPKVEEALQTLDVT